MQRVMSFYENLPRGPAPVLEPTGFIGRYRAKHFGDKPTAKREWYRLRHFDETQRLTYLKPLFISWSSWLQLVTPRTTTSTFVSSPLLRSLDSVIC